MNGIGLEGYTGMGWEDGLLIQDILTLVLIVLLSIFAYAFYTCLPLFEKMIRGVFSLKERQNLFDTATSESVFFNVFMRFQALFLYAVILFLVFCHITGIEIQRFSQAFSLMSILLIMLILIYLLKRLLYYLYGRVFISKGKYKLWNTNYHTLFYLCGICLYLPVVWLMLSNDYFIYALVLFCAIFVLFRISVIYIKIRIFYNKNNGFLFLMLYLCAQEIVPDRKSVV